MGLEEHAEIHVSDDLWARALGRRYCSICSILQNKTSDLLCSLQFEAVRDREVNALVLSAGGYCHFHFWYLEKLASPVTNAQLLEDLLKKIEHEFLEDTSGGAASTFNDASRCPVCRSCKEWEEKLLVSFARKIPERDFRTAYERSRGLCLPHLSEVLKRLADQEPRAFLVKRSRHQLGVLIQELRLLMMKWRNKDRSPGGESDSTYRAIGTLVAVKTIGPARDALRSMGGQELAGATRG